MCNEYSMIKQLSGFVRSPYRVLLIFNFADYNYYFVTHELSLIEFYSPYFQKKINRNCSAIIVASLECTLMCLTAVYVRGYKLPPRKRRWKCLVTLEKRQNVAGMGNSPAAKQIVCITHTHTYSQGQCAVNLQFRSRVWNMVRSSVFCCVLPLWH